METRGHLLDADEEQLKRLISQAYPPVESPPGVREDVFKRVMAEYDVVSHRRSLGIWSLWARVLAPRPLWTRAALVVSLLLMLSLTIYNLPLSWKLSEHRVEVRVISGSAEFLIKGILGQETSTTVGAGGEETLAREGSIATTVDQEMTFEIGGGAYISLLPGSQLDIVPGGAKVEGGGTLLRLQNGEMQYTGDSSASISIEIQDALVSAADAEFRAQVIASNHVQLAADRGAIDIEVGDQPFVVHEWEEINTALAPDEMVRPQPPIIEIPGGSIVTKEANVLIHGLAQPGSVVVIYSSDGHLGQIVANAQGHFEYEIRSLSENGYEIWAVATGPRGTTSSESKHIYLEFDRTPPKLEILSPYWPDVSSSPILFEGMTEPGAQVFVNAIEVNVDGQGRFSIQMPLQTGDNRVTLRVSDAAGNEFIAGMVIRLH